MTEDEMELQEIAAEEWAGLSLPDHDQASWFAGFKHALRLAREAHEAGLM